MTMITPSYLGETIEYSSLHACRSTLEDPTELPFVMVSAIVVGGVFGYFLDRWLHTKPVLMLILGGVGFYAGVRDVLRRLSRSSDGNG